MTIPQASSASIVVPVAGPAAGSAPILRPTRVGAALETRWRVLAGLVGIVGLVFGGVLAWREQTEGLAVASAFAVGLITLIFAFAGVVPASIKVGDVEVQLKQAVAEGKEQGKQEGKEEGKQEGAVAGLQTAAAVCEKVKEGLLLPEEVEAALAEALSTAAPLDLPAVSAAPLAVADLGADASATASAIAQALSPATPDRD
jgi:hypothetical protein